MFILPIPRLRRTLHRQVRHRADPKAQNAIRTEQGRGGTCLGVTGTARHLFRPHAVLPLHDARGVVRFLGLVDGQAPGRSAGRSCSPDHLFGSALSVPELGRGLEAPPRSGVITLALLPP